MVSIGRSDGHALSDEDLQEIRNSLAGHAYVEAFPGSYVIGLLFEDERRQIIDELQQVAEKQDSELFAIVVSPTMQAGATYNGWLEAEIWDAINLRTGRQAKSSARADDA